MTLKFIFYKTLENPSYILRLVTRKAFHSLEDTIRSSKQLGKQSQIVNQKLIKVIGLRRSGNHAIINWIIPQQTGIVRHLNNISIRGNYYRELCDKLHDYHPEIYLREKERLEKEARGDFELKDCLICNYEDYNLKQLTSQKMQKRDDFYFGKSLVEYNLLILRDPFNTLASRLNAPKDTAIDLRVNNRAFIKRWIAYAKEFLGETQFLKNNKVVVNYNQWFSDLDYRKQIASHLNLKFSDKGINQVRGFGGGSSFDKCDFSGQAQKMKVLERWQQFSDDVAFKNLLGNEELIYYSEQIFGHIPGTEALKI